MKDIYLIVAFLVGLIVIFTVLWCFFKGKNQENKMGWVTLPLIGVVLMSFPILDKIKIKGPQGEAEVAFRSYIQDTSKLVAQVPNIIQLIPLTPKNKAIVRQLEEQSKKIVDIQDQLIRGEKQDRETITKLERQLSSATDKTVEGISAVMSLHSKITTSPPSK